MLKKCISLIVCLTILLSFPFVVFAEEMEAEKEEKRVELAIFSLNTFLQFAENCRLDSYSRKLDVKLETDLDLSDTTFTSIPIFGGSFDGNGHTISGLNNTAEGSVQGLFRYLEETAVVKNLHISGTVTPEGSKTYVGGLAGSNAGTIENCTFSGEVSGGDYVGGLVGVNTLTGTIEDCSVEGRVYGNHFIGGITGDNQGVIRKSVNYALINITPAQNTVNLQDITLETISGAEAANTVTDVGGITGTGTGVIRGCANQADVGYPQMGYNIGGIAGSFVGYITDSRNYGVISGRKEVGGIVGQMEPLTKIEYSQDTLQQLDEQLDTMSGLTNQAAANAQSSAGEVTNQISQLQKELETAQKALDSLLEDTPETEPEDPAFPSLPQLPETPQLPDEDTILAARNMLSSSLSGVQQSLTGIAGTAQNAAGTLASDLQAVANQAGQMGQTLNEASENIGGSVTDISDQDTDDDQSAKVEKCTNRGIVSADLNAGGIAGAISIENDLDPEADVDVFGDASMNVTSELRSVIRGCANEASVIAKKQNGGGIVGWMQLGLVRECDNFGETEAAQYAGGIAGNSYGFIRNCNAKSKVTGTAFVGGIAGSGKIVSDCRSMVLLIANEKYGEVLGRQEKSQEEMPVKGNVYMSLEKDLGGIDGVSYDGCAQGLKKKDFFALEDLPERFSFITVTFVFEDGRMQKVILEPGQKLEEEKIPQVPEKEGYCGIWENLQMEIPFDTSVSLKYTPLGQVRQSALTGQNELPVLMMETVKSGLLTVTEVEKDSVITEGELLCAWQFDEVAEESTVRCLIPEGADSERIGTLVLDADGNWYQTQGHVKGSYVVADINAGDRGISLVQLPVDYTLWYFTAGTAAVLMILIVIFVAAKRGKQKKQTQTA